ncbi:MAG TPA: RnfABCDGE type electron transport complex subunit D [Solimonas sp.]
MRRISLSALGAQAPQMARVLVALLPGLIAHALLIDPGVLVRLLVAASVAGGMAALSARRSSRALELGWLITAAVLALALPPTLPLAAVAIASGIAAAAGMLAARDAGLVPFNPAMVAYVVVAIFAPALLYAPVDAASGATLLTRMTDALRQQQTLGELFEDSGVGFASLTVGMAWMAGGIWLIRRRLIPWQIPLGTTLGLTICALMPWMLDGDRYASPFVHLFSGAVLFAAFFVATEPRSSPRQARARLLYGVGIGALLYAIRGWGDYPDGIAFAVLLMNFLVPLLDRLTSNHAAEPLAR